jgi:hypothetical protein
MTTNVLQTTLKFLLVVALAMPIGLAIADDDDKKRDENAMLKCAESIGIRFNEQGQIVDTISDDDAGFDPTIVMLETTFDEGQEPASCGHLATCGECLKDLINISGCRAHKAFPGSPLIVNSSIEPIDLGMGPNDVLFLSITEYVFRCRGG